MVKSGFMEKTISGPLSEAKLRSLKPKDKRYRVGDRDGMYAEVAPTGSISFRYNYRLSGRQESKRTANPILKAALL